MWTVDVKTSAESAAKSGDISTGQIFGATVQPNPNNPTMWILIAGAVLVAIVWLTPKRRR
jgi:hypothetical protein